MSKQMVVIVGMIICLTISGSAIASDSARNARVVAHIAAVYAQGDLPVAKLLVDFAIADRASLKVSTSQYERLLALRKQIYVSCIVDQVVLARKIVIDQHDGHGALRVLQRVQYMANVIDIELYGLDELLGVVFYAAAAQNMAMAIDADREGDTAYALELRLQANEFFQWALAFDRRIERLILDHASR